MLNTKKISNQNYTTLTDELSHLPVENLLQFISVIFPMLPAITTTQHDARLLRDIIDLLTKENLVRTFIRILTPHIIHKIITLEENTMLTELLLEEMNFQIAITKKGCNFIQKCTENFKGQSLINILSAI